MNAKMTIAEFLRDGARADIWKDAEPHIIKDAELAELIEKTKQAMLDAADILAEIAADEEIDYVGPCRFQPEDVRLQADYVAEYMDIPELTDEDVEAIWDEVRGELKHTTEAEQCEQPNADSDACPACGSTQIEGDAVEFDNINEVSQFMGCSDCNSEWVNIYELKEQMMVDRED